MKKSFLIFFLSISFGTFCQSTESLKAATKKLFEANYLMDFETIVSFSYPKMIETVGSDAMLAIIEKHYENEEYRLRLQLEAVPFQYGGIQKIEGKSFCVITCRNPIRYTFETKLTTEAAAEKASWIKEIDKTKEVTFEPARNSFNVKKISTFVAILDETTSNQWKFFNFDDQSQQKIFEDFFGESIKKELGL
jgi:hypothetical protein